MLKFSRFTPAQEEQKPPESQINAHFFDSEPSENGARVDSGKVENPRAAGEKSSGGPDAMLGVLYSHARAAERIYGEAKKDKKG
ncbi:MAG: hypothetical protein J6126_06265 [Clostridia bacterium]|nr:hypothetical protein [Clostridia bacterium]